jgi:3-(3-hydroxy-phenyl)propionate hydroxylase
MGGVCLQVCHKHQVLNRPDLNICWQDESGELIPNTAPVGWVAVIRPDQVIMHDGPVERVDFMLNEVIEMLQNDASNCA